MASILGILAVLILSLLLVPAQKLQYCEQRDAWETNFCAAVNSVKNATTGADDLYFSVSVLYPRGNGWLAIGTGYMMHQSLMFVMYPSLNSDGTTLSLRTTAYHSPPQEIAASTAPDVRVATNELNSDGYHVISFLCYGCTSWGGVGINAQSASQPWVWASNFWQGPSADSGSSLSKHTDYSVFFMDMAASHLEEAGRSAYPTISSSRERINASPDSEMGLIKSSKTPTMYVLHGLLMCTVFGAFFPAGVFALKMSSGSAVRFHGIIQVVLTALALLGIAMPFVRACRQGTLLGLHQMIGSLLGIALCVQIYLGCAHHISFVKSKLQGTPTQSGRHIESHVWLGRAIWLLGALNVFIGLRMASASGFVRLSWILLELVEVVGLALLMINRRQMREQAPQEVEKACFVIGYEDDGVAEGLQDQDDEETIKGIGD